MVLAIGVFSAYTVAQLRGLTRLQTEIVDRNRADSLLLLRIQNSLSALGTTMRDMLDGNEPYAMSAWRNQVDRIQTDLEDAVKKQAMIAPVTQAPEQNRYLETSVAQFREAFEQVFRLAEADEAAARTRVRLSLQARHESVTATVSRLLVQNYNREQRAAEEMRQVHREVEQNLYLFLAAMLVVIGFTSMSLVRYNRRIFKQVSALAEQRRELAQQLISAQESTLRSLSREMHDEFGQTLTAVGTALQRAQRVLGASHGALRAELHDVHQAVQTMLDRMRRLSHSLHPVILDGMGLEGAMEAHIPRFEGRTGLAVRFVRPVHDLRVPRDTAVHVYRVFQESLSNAAQHSGATMIDVRLECTESQMTLEVEDDGAGFRQPAAGTGIGLTSMRERAGIIGGTIEFVQGRRGGALVRLIVPVQKEVADEQPAV
jgi:signal transduction histidine kinase